MQPRFDVSSAKLVDFSNLNWGGETIENSYWKALALCLVLVFIRGWDRLMHAHLWAEDGATYLQQGLAEGWSSLFNEYGGYYHFYRGSSRKFSWNFPCRRFLLPFACFVTYAMPPSLPNLRDLPSEFMSPPILPVFSQHWCFASSRVWLKFLGIWRIF